MKVLSTTYVKQTSEDHHYLLEIGAFGVKGQNIMNFHFMRDSTQESAVRKLFRLCIIVVFVFSRAGP